MCGSSRRGTTRSLAAMARLIGAFSGERYCLPEVGKSKDWKIPPGHEPFPLQWFLGRVLLKVRQDDQGNWRPYKDEKGIYVESPAPVAGFVGHDSELRIYGCLAEIMDCDGWVKVQFGTTPLQEHSHDAPLIDLSEISTSPTPKRY